MTLAILAVGFSQEIPPVVVEKGKPCHHKVSEHFNYMPFFLELDQLQVKRERVITHCKKVFLQGVSQWLKTEGIAAEQNQVLHRQVFCLDLIQGLLLPMKGSLIWRPSIEMSFGRSGTSYIEILFVIWVFTPYLFFAKVFQSSECPQALQKTKWLW